MEENELPRLSRLTAILTILQTKRIITSTELAKKFGVSIRTIYRDMRALEASGIPIYTEEGKGYSLVEGYRLPPVTFTEIEANALITAEHLVLANSDKSLIENYSNAISKIKALLRKETKEKVQLLSNRMYVWQGSVEEMQSKHLSTLQLAITNYNLVKIIYETVENEVVSKRIIEPFATYKFEKNNWLLIAWCRLRNDFRNFRIDKIKQIEVLNEKFEPHKMTFDEYYEKYIKPEFLPLTQGCHFDF
jgi:predicted DNA-binding transcriptional regulator YafY